jgi:hypothetical protein
MDKTFEAMCKLEDVELELHRLKNALEMMTRAYNAKKEWIGLTDEERTFLAWESNNGRDCVAMTEAKLKEKNT